MQISYLGPPGTHSHEAAEVFKERFFPQAILRPCPGFQDALNDAIMAPPIPTCFACVPIENSIQGAVTQVWDTLTVHMGSRSEAYADPTHGILAAITQPIRQYVIHRPGTEFAKVERVFSHPQALAQCKEHIQALFPSATPTAVSSTADAARIVSEEERSISVAIGNPRAAQAYGLLFHPDSVEDQSGNVTRFALVGPTTPLHIPSGLMTPTERVVSLCLRGVTHQPGGLVGALAPFAQAALNLSRVESRPVGDELGHYVFYVDISMEADDKQAELTVVTVTQQLKANGTDVVKLGTYPVYQSGGLARGV